jgi:DNA-binding beta-propeller fold protein YncE
VLIPKETQLFVNNNHRLQIFDTNGQSIKVIGGPTHGNGNGQFYYPWGIDIDANDSIVVVDHEIVGTLLA